MTVVALTMRIVEAGGYNELRDAISHDWTKFLEAHEIVPLLVPNAMNRPELLLERLGAEGVIIGNGEDIPVIYGDGQTIDFSGPRERTEKKILDYAMRNRLPVLGVCRGMQFINLYFGGSLARCDDICQKPGQHVSARHPIEIVEGRFVDVSSDGITVNSYHGNCVTQDSISPSLEVFATDIEGRVIEGFYHPELPVVGIQWHPEREGASEELDLAIMEKLFIRKEREVAVS